MKFGFSALLILFSATLFGQGVLPYDNAGKIVFYEKVQVDSAGPDVLYRRAKTWVLENFTNLNKVVKEDNSSGHIIVLRGSGECYAPHSFGDTIENAENSFTMKIEIESSGYSYTISDFYTTDKWKGELPTETVKRSKKQMQLLEQSILELAATLTASLKHAMALKIVVGGE